MTVRDQPRLRQEALVAATIAVKTAKRNQSTLAVAAEAERIYRRYPTCLVSRAELKAEMIRLGRSDRVQMKFG